MSTTARHDRTRPASADGQVIGAMLVLAGVAWLLHRSGALRLSWETTLSVLLVTLGLGLVVTARRQGGGGLIALGIAISAVLASTSSIDVGVMKEGVGDRAIRPRTVAAARGENALGVGHLQIDLRDLDLPAGETTRLNYRMGLGELDVLLPDDTLAKVRVTARLEGGELLLLGTERSGGGLRLTRQDEGYAEAETKLDIVVRMGFGQLQVGRAPF